MSAPINSRTQLQPKPLTIPKEFGGLTLKQHAFVDHYIRTGNATDSAVKAGFTEDRNSAHVIGSRLLRNVTVVAEIRRRLGIAIAGPNEVLETLTKHARGDATDIVDSNGELDLRKARRKRITKKIRTKRTIRYTRNGEKIEEIVTEAEIHDPQAALEKLGRFHQLFPTRVEITTGDLDAAINRAIEEHGLPVIEASATVTDVESPATTTDSDTYPESNPAQHNS